jgi:hypothetical protein
MQTEENNPPPGVPEPPITIANLDVNGVYFGVTTLDPANPPAVVVPVPADCDLKPGGYFWNAEHQRFDPRPDGLVLAEPGQVSLEQAINALAVWAIERGATSPLLSQFVADFKKSVDAIGGVK